MILGLFGSRSPGRRARNGAATLSLALSSALFLTLALVMSEFFTASMPYLAPERLVELVSVSQVGERGAVSVTEFLDYQRELRSIGQIAAFQRWDDAVDWETRSMLKTAAVSPGYFELLGITPQLGRTFSGAETLASRVAIISAPFWRQRFGGAADVLGRSIPYAGGDYTVVGVLPDDFRHFQTGRIDAWTPWALAGGRDNRRFLVIGRLADGRSLNDARAETRQLSQSLASKFPVSNADWSVVPRPLSDRELMALTPVVTLLLAGMVVALLTALLNVVHSMLASTIDDSKATAIRIALGATPARLAMSAFRSVASLTIIGTAAGAGLTVLIWRPLTHLLLPFMPYLEGASVAYESLLAGAIAFGLLGVSTAVVPIMHILWLRPASLLATGGVNAPPARQRGFRVVMISQIACVNALLIAALSLGATLVRAQMPDMGFQYEGVSAARVMVRPDRATLEYSTSVFGNVLQNLRSNNDATAVGITNVPPFTPRSTIRTVPIFIGPESTQDAAELHVVLGDYFRALKIPVLAGRAFNLTDMGQPVAVVSAQLARRYGDPQNLIGASIQLGGVKDVRRSVIGVVGDVSPMPEAVREPIVYVPEVRWSRLDVTFVARDTTAARRGVRTLASVVRDADPSLFVDGYELTDSLATLNASLKAMALLAGANAVILLALLAAAVHEALFYLYRSRHTDYVIRLALGAGVGRVRQLVVREAVVCLVSGVAVGLVLWSLVRQLSSLLNWPLSPVEIWPLIGSMGLLSAVVLTGAIAVSRMFTDIGMAELLKSE
jgi:predicted permease